MSYIKLHTEEAVGEVLSKVIEEKKTTQKSLSDKGKAEELIKGFWDFSEIIEFKPQLEKMAHNQKNDSPLKTELKDTIQFIEEIESRYREAVSNLTGLFQKIRLSNKQASQEDQKTAYEAIDTLIKSTQKAFFDNSSFIPSNFPETVKKDLRDPKYANRYMQAYIDAKKANFKRMDNIPEKITLHQVILKVIEETEAKELCANSNLPAELYQYIAPKIDFIMYIKNVDARRRGEIIQILKNNIQNSLPQRIESCLQEREKIMALLSLSTDLHNMYYDKLSQLEDVQGKKIFEKLHQEINEKIRKITPLFEENNAILSSFLFKFCQEQGFLITSNELNKLPTIENGDVQKFIKEELKAEELSWSAWFNTATFRSRLRNMVIGLASGGGAGFVASTPLLFVAPPLVLAGAAVTSVGAAIAGFYSPEIKKSIEDNAEQMMTQLQSFFATVLDEFEKEFPRDRIAEKFQETDIMKRTFGVQAAKSIALFYVNNLFEIQLKIRYGTSLPEEVIKNLKAIYFHLLKNYQMIRGDDNEIKNIYKDQTWGPDMADAQITKMNKLRDEDRRVLLKNDVALFSTLLRQQAVERECHVFQNMMTIEQAFSQASITYSPEFEQFKTHFGIEFSSSTVPLSKEEEKEEEKKEEKSLALFKLQNYPVVKHKTQNVGDSLILAANKEEDKIKSAFNDVVLYSTTQSSQQSFIAELKRMAKYAAEFPEHTEKLPSLSITLKTGKTVDEVVKDYLSREFTSFLYFIEHTFKNKTKEEVIDLLSKVSPPHPSLFQTLANDSVKGVHYFALLAEKLKSNGILFIDYCDVAVIKKAYQNGNVDFFNGCVKILESQYDGMLSAQKEKAYDVLPQLLEERVSSDFPPYYGALCYHFAQIITDAAGKKNWWYVNNDPRDEYCKLLMNMNDKGNAFNESQFIERVSNKYNDNEENNISVDMLKTNQKRTVDSFNEKMNNIDSGENPDENFEKIKKFVSNVYNSALTPEQKEVFFKTIRGTLSENDTPIIRSMIFDKNIKIDGKNIFWIAIEMNKHFLIPLLYKNSYETAIDYAGPQGSAFTFAAKQENKDAYSHFCEGAAGAWTKKGFTRFLKDESGRNSFHYIAETGTLENIQKFLNMQKTSVIQYIKDTWGAIQFNTPDQNKNTPMNLIFSRSDVNEIIQVIQTAIQGYTLFDLDIKEKVVSDFSQPTVIEVLKNKPKILLAISNHIITNQATIPAEKRNHAFSQALALSLETDNEESLSYLLNNLITFYTTQNPSWVSGSSNPLNALLPELLDIYCLKAKTEEQLEAFSNIIKAKDGENFIFPQKDVDLFNKLEAQAKARIEKQLSLMLAEPIRQSPVMFREVRQSSSPSHRSSPSEHKTSPKRERRNPP